MSISHGPAAPIRNAILDGALSQMDPMPESQPMTRTRSRRPTLLVLGIRLGAVLLALVAVGISLAGHPGQAPPEISQELSLEVEGLH